MKENHFSILDQFNEEPTKRWFQHWSIVFGPLILFAIGEIFNIQKWPFSHEIIAVSLLLILIRSAIFFFLRKRNGYEWLFFAAKIGLIVVLILNFGFARLNAKSIATALVIFVVGAILLRKKKTPKNNQPEEFEEQDEEFE